MEPETLSEEPEICRVRGLDLILKSINCEKYKAKFISHGINEHTMLYLTESDLRTLDVCEEDMKLMLNAVNVLSKTLNLSEVRLSNEDIIRLQTIICGQLGTIALTLTHIFYSLSNDKNQFSDVLIDDCLSSIDAAMMVKPYLRTEEASIEKTIKKVYKMNNRRTLLTIAVVSSATAVLLLGFFTLRRH